MDEKPRKSKYFDNLYEGVDPDKVDFQFTLLAKAIWKSAEEQVHREKKEKQAAKEAAEKEAAEKVEAKKPARRDRKPKAADRSEPQEN